MKYSIDRFEGEFAVLQDDERNSMDVLRSLLPDNARQGDVVIFEDEKWRIDAEETSTRRDRVKKLQQRLLNKHKK
ncbi:MAG: DUF3006 domain-containing protein [Clostridiales bacterium]|nr:DUF3006 domain-containing protein [Clostridiales bacterium]